MTTAPAPAPTPARTIRTRLAAIVEQAATARSKFTERAIAGESLDKLSALTAQLSAADAAAGALRAELRRAAIAEIDGEIRRLESELAPLAVQVNNHYFDMERARESFRAIAEREYPRADPRIQAYARVAILEERSEGVHERFAAGRERLAKLRELRERGDADEIVERLDAAKE